MADCVAAALRRMFNHGEITEGTMLPPESELMERFGVSRPTLREALRILESESLIEVQRGVRGGGLPARNGPGHLLVHRLRSRVMMPHGDVRRSPKRST